MSENLNEIAVIPAETLNSELANLSEGRNAGFYSSIKGTDFASKLVTLEAMSNSAPVSESLNKRIMVVDIIIQATEMVDEETGAMTSQPRIILITEDGKAFHAMSGPLYRDVKNWFGVLGAPSEWEGPLPVKITQEGSGNRKYFKASMVK